MDDEFQSYVLPVMTMNFNLMYVKGKTFTRFVLVSTSGKCGTWDVVVVEMDYVGKG